MAKAARQTAKRKNRGSGKPPEPRHLVVGRVVNAWGVRGEVKVEIMTDFPERFGLLQQLYLGDDLRSFELESWRPHKGAVLLKLKGCDDRNTAESLRGQEVQIPVEQAMPLTEDEYYEYQIIGLAVHTTDGEDLGQVAEIIYTGSNDVYVVRGQREEILIPALEDVVLKVDLVGGRLVVELPEGLVG